MGERMTAEQEAAIRADLDCPENRDPSCRNCHPHILLREVDALTAERDALRAALAAAAPGDGATEGA